MAEQPDYTAILYEKRERVDVLAKNVQELAADGVTMGQMASDVLVARK